MTVLSSLAAAGLWPALPLTGCALVGRPLRGRAGVCIPAVTRFALLCTLGLAVWSPLLLFSAALRLYRPEWVGLLGWIVTACVALALYRRGERPAPRSRWPSPLGWALGAGLAVAGALYLGFPTESILGLWDDNSYASLAMYIAHHGRLDIPYPWPAQADALFFDAFERLTGTYKTRPTMQAGFGHLLPVWLAHAFATFGHHGLYRLNGVLLLLSIATFYGVCRLLLSEAQAVAASLFLALNPSHLYIGRITLTEPLSQLLIWSAMLLLLRAHRDGSRASALWSGVLLGLSPLVRLDNFLLVAFLFLAHLGMRLVEGPSRRTAGLWRAFYLSALPGFALGLAYYLAYSSSYFQKHAHLLRPVGVIVIASVLLLLAGSARIGILARPIRLGRPLVLGGSALVLVLAAYAYWIRPITPPFHFTQSPIASPWNGRRSYVELALPNLAAYLSPLVVWAAIPGWLAAASLLARRGRDTYLAALLVLVGGMSAVYLWNPQVAPRHFWAIRRFVPVIIPGFVLFAALTYSLLSVRLPGGRRRAAAVSVVAFLSGWTVWADRSLWNVAEHAGEYARVRAVAEVLPPDAPLLAVGGKEWWKPLYLAFDRPIVHVDEMSGAGRQAMRQWVRERTAREEPTYLLSDGRAELRGLRSELLATHSLTQRYIARSIYPLRNEVGVGRAELRVYRIDGLDERFDLSGVNLVTQPIWTVQESGFGAPDVRRGRALNRPVDGSARLVVPLGGRWRPVALQVRLGAERPPGTRLRIRVNGETLYDGLARPGRWEARLGLGPVPLGGQATIELDGYRPTRGGVGVRASRIAVRTVALLNRKGAADRTRLTSGTRAP